MSKRCDRCQLPKIVALCVVLKNAPGAVITDKRTFMRVERQTKQFVEEAAPDPQKNHMEQIMDIKIKTLRLFNLNWIQNL